MSSAPSWLDHVLVGLPAPLLGTLAILLDPNKLIPEAELSGWERLTARSRWEARQQYEQHLRTRPPEAPPALLQVVSAELTKADQLPWDLAQLPIASVDPRLPAELVRALPDLPEDVALALCAATRSGAAPGQVLARQVLGLALPAPDAVAELHAASRALSAGLPPAARALIAAELTTELAKDAAGLPAPDGPLVQAWDDWCRRGPSSSHSRIFSGCGPELLVLIEAGLVRVPADRHPTLPDWLGPAAGEDPTPRIRSLLAAGPELPTDFAGWTEVATWWARVRWALAAGQISEDVVEQAWKRWGELDAAFLLWLRANYANELGRAFLPPRTVDKVAPFLAHSLRKRGRPQVLVVMDGMGLAQWNQVSSAVGFVEVERHVVLAGLPSVTHVSRQAIFAGAPPISFPHTIGAPAEGRLWRGFWAGQGVADLHIQYLPTNGRDLPAVRSDAQAIGLVVNTIDEAMHSVGGFDDAGFRDLVARFAAGTFLSEVAEMATSLNADLWFTADHGNLSCRGMPERVPHQGLRVRSRGKRVWTYATDELRAAANVPGLAWDPPGYPPNAGYPLFALGRTCYERDAVLVSHGGLSFDEVLVPLVRVQT